MSDALLKTQLEWIRMLKDAEPGACKNPPTIDLTNVVTIEPLEIDARDLGGCDIETEVNPTTTAPLITGFGECIVCHKDPKRIWAGVCAMCGADDDDLEEE